MSIRKVIIGWVIWMGVLLLALPQGPSFVARLITFVWFLVGVAGLYFATRKPPAP